MTNNNALNTKAPENIGGLTAKNTPSPTVYLGKTLDVIGDDVWTLSLAPKGVDAVGNGVTVYHKDAVNRYAFLRGIGYEIAISSYSKMAIVVKLKSQEAKTFVLKASVKKGDLESVMTVNNRFWYASKINDITENKDAKNKTADTQIEKCAVELFGDFSDAEFKGKDICFNVEPYGETYIYIGVGPVASLRTPSLTELRNGSYARMLNYSLTAPFAEGGGLSGLGRELPFVYSHKRYDESVGWAYVDNTLTGEESALVGVLAGDIGERQILAYATPSTLFAVTAWTAFSMTRNHRLLLEAYDILKDGKENGNATEKFLYCDVMERASRILGKDNQSYLEKASAYKPDALKTLGDKGEASPVKSYYRYLLALHSGDYFLVQKERESAIQKFNASKKSLGDYIYYFIALNATIGVNAFTKDLRPALNFGTHSGSDTRVSNLSFFTKKTILTSFKDGLKLNIEGKDVFSLVGSTAIVSDFKEEIGGVSFNVKALSPATLTLITPPFSSKKGKNNVFKLRIGEEYIRVVIKNNKLRVEKL